MEEIWIISRLVFYSHQFYHDFLHQAFLAPPRNFPTMNRCLLAMKLPPSPQLNFLKGPHGDGRGQAALALCRVDPWAFLGDLWNERKHSPSFSWLEDDTSPTKPPWIFLGKKMSRPPVLSCQKTDLFYSHSNLQTPPTKTWSDEKHHLKLQQTFICSN